VQLQGLTFRKKPQGQMAPKFSDLVASKSSEKHEKLVASQKNVVTLATQAFSAKSCFQCSSCIS